MNQDEGKHVSPRNVALLWLRIKQYILFCLLFLLVITVVVLLFSEVLSPFYAVGILTAGAAWILDAAEDLEKVRIKESESKEARGGKHMRDERIAERVLRSILEGEIENEKSKRNRKKNHKRKRGL